jgi:hypothetical protein
MDQTCLANSGGFAPISFPLFQGVRFSAGRMELNGIGGGEDLVGLLVRSR